MIWKLFLDEVHFTRDIFINYAKKQIEKHYGKGINVIITVDLSKEKKKV